MDVDLRIKSGANIFLGLAIVSLAYDILFPFSTLWSFIVPAYAFVAPGLNLDGSHKLLALVVEAFIAGALVVFGIAGQRRIVALYVAGIIAYAFDGLRAALVVFGVAGIPIEMGIGFLGILMVIVHCIALYFMWSGLTAMLTARANERLARNWEVQSALERKLEHDEPVPTPPPAADFKPRRHGTPPASSP